MGGIKRTIHFHLAEFKNDTKSIPPKDVFNEFELKVEKGEIERYLELEEGKYHFVKSETQDNMVRGLIASSREIDLPFEEIEYEIGPLHLSNEGAKLCEVAHFIIFSANIMTMEFNIRAPRVGSLMRYLLDKMKDKIDSASFPSLVNEDIGHRLDNLFNPKSIEIKVKTEEMINATAVSDDFHKGLKLISKDIRGDELHIKALGNIKIPKRDSLRKKKVSDLKKQRIKAINIEGKEDQDESYMWYRLLDDKLMVSRTVLKHSSNSRNVDTKDIYEIMEQVYQDKYEEIHYVKRQIRQIYS